jgi:TRAP-type mannitol/chloroaromatic compound transport system permease small subunit
MFNKFFYILHKLFFILSCLSLLLLIFLTVKEVVARYFLNSPSIAMQELQLHLFAVIFLLGSTWTFKYDRHVRIDIFYAKLSDRTNNIINIIGIVFFLLPSMCALFYYSLLFVEQSYLVSERSADLSGLPFIWLVKSLIPISAALLFSEGLLNLLNRLLR